MTKWSLDSSCWMLQFAAGPDGTQKTKQEPSQDRSRQMQLPTVSVECMLSKSVCSKA